ncbi:uncharacterized protein LOC117339846 [Pecten maximus]|uniref:uncharacterized protein LOC117339846 n=1 Tax=Pecten maximus TaxID=6579 RepID=UPI0014582BBB|nr:uncharacterized protein LOC117339846 [Pecten maximus]
MAAVTPGKRKHFDEGRDDARAVDISMKRCRMDNCFSTTGHMCIDFPERLLDGVMNVLMNNLCGRYCGALLTVTPLIVINSNAADESRPVGYTFPKAYCSISKYDKQFVLSSLFKTGLDILMDYVEQKKLPPNNEDKYVLDILLHFIFTLTSTGAQSPFDELDHLSETDRSIILANHLFGKLSTSSHFVINKHWKGRAPNAASCSCSNPSCKMTGLFGDTSIGNETVWHGNLDVIVNDEVVVEVLEDLQNSPGGKSPVKVKLKTSSFSRNPQIIAKTIVFSFLQKKRHPERSHFLTPCIGVTGSDLVIYCYDSEHDTLLESSTIPLFAPDSVTGGINLTAIVVTWLVVNHKYLCSGLIHMDDLKTLKSGFFDQIQAKCDVYENELQIGGIVPQNYNAPACSAPNNLVFDATAVIANNRCLKIGITRNGLSKK